MQKTPKKEGLSQLSEKAPLHFPTQRPNEQVILLLRRHWTVLFKEIAQAVAILLIPTAIIAVIVAANIVQVEPGSPLYVVLVEGMSLLYLFIFLGYFHNFIDYHLDIWVVTDQRIVAIEQEGLFKRTVSELSMTKIQDVTSEVSGKVQTFLDYGQVHIQTAGERERFIFEDIDHPAQVAKIIMRIHDTVLKREEIERIRMGEQVRQHMDEGVITTGEDPIASESQSQSPFMPPEDDGDIPLV